jgi:peptide subunit release factor RF-3
MVYLEKRNEENMDNDNKNNNSYNQNNDHEVLTLRDVARILRCRTRQIYELTRRRLQERSSKPLPVFTIHSKMKRVRRKDLLNWLDELVKDQRQQSKS